MTGCVDHNTDATGPPGANDDPCNSSGAGEFGAGSFWIFEDDCGDGVYTRIYVRIGDTCNVDQWVEITPQPVRYVRYTDSGATPLVPHNVETCLVGGVETHNNCMAGELNVATGELTVAETGEYLVTFSIAGTGDNGGDLSDSRVIPTIRVNGTVREATHFNINSNHVDTMGWTTSRHLNLNAGDVVRFCVNWQNDSVNPSTSNNLVINGWETVVQQTFYP